MGVIGDLLARGLRGAALDQAYRSRDDAPHRAGHDDRAAAGVRQPHVPAIDQRDALGLPRPTISNHYDAYTRRRLEDARGLHQQVFSALGVTELHHATT